MHKLSRALVVLALLSLSTACGGGSSGDDGGSGNCPDPFSTSLSGFWYVEEQSTSTGCPTGMNRFQILCTQAGAKLTFIGRTTFGMTMCGSRATNDFSFSVPTTSGLLTYKSVVLTWSSETRFTGTAQWTLQSGSTTCTGSSTLTGTR